MLVPRLPHVLVQICSKADAIIGLDGQQIYWEQEEGEASEYNLTLVKE